MSSLLGMGTVPKSKPQPSRYALSGDVAQVTSLDEEAFEGEVEAVWFSATIDRKELKSLMKRSDAAGYRHFGLWLVLLIGSLIGVIVTWRSWATLPFLAVYGVMYAMSDHHAHELSHGTPFKNRTVNEALYQLSGFMTLHEGAYWRWSHTRHHTNTLLVGQDPEIALQRPPNLTRMWLDFFNLPAGTGQIRNLTRMAFTGKVTADGTHFIPEAERGKVIRNSRIYVAIFVAVLAASISFRSWLPVLLVVTPRFWGGVFAQAFNVTQHAGLPEEVYDHRRNCRTVYLNPVFRFLYMNMNYHVEHHMFPMVPFNQLPKLHEAIKAQCAPASPGVLAAWREFLPVVRRQQTDPSFVIVRDLPG
jgi:fatty acid desaturase